MILLVEPASTILLVTQENQAADHLINALLVTDRLRWTVDRADWIEEGNSVVSAAPALQPAAAWLRLRRGSYGTAEAVPFT